MTSGQISYGLRRLRTHQIIERIPHSRSYHVTVGYLHVHEDRRDHTTPAETLRLHGLD
jgi:hypothetical protein